jgi:hypothetical protein
VIILFFLIIINDYYLVVIIFLFSYYCHILFSFSICINSFRGYKDPGPIPLLGRITDKTHPSDRLCFSLSSTLTHYTGGFDKIEKYFRYYRIPGFPLVGSRSEVHCKGNNFIICLLCIHNFFVSLFVFYFYYESIICFLSLQFLRS